MEIDDILHRIYREANLRLLYPRMVSGHQQGQLLSILTHLIAPRRALEIGTFAGYSALCIARALKPEARLDTIEIDDELEPFITKGFSSTPVGDKIKLHIGDALQIIPQLHQDGITWNMAFIDADKRLYPQYLELLLEIMPKGSYILADNTLWPGASQITLDQPPPSSRHELQSYGIALFNHFVAHDKRLESFTLPIRDGLTIIKIK